MNFWSVPRIWEGRAVAILASGPSMSQAVADAARGLPTIVVNNTFELAGWADMLYAADEKWWEHHPAARRFAGLKVSVGNIKGVHRLQLTGALGYDPDPQRIRTGSNSGYQAVHIAMTAGARRILLLGFDLQGSHWHGEHKQPLENTTDWAFGNWRKRFAELAPIAERMGVEIWNCTPASALTCFAFREPFETLEREVRAAQLESACDETKAAYCGTETACGETPADFRETPAIIRETQ